MNDCCKIPDRLMNDCCKIPENRVTVARTEEKWHEVCKCCNRNHYGIEVEAPHVTFTPVSLVPAV